MERFQAFDIDRDYEEMHRSFAPAKEAPVIGLTGNFGDGTCKLLEGYYASIRRAGGTPMIIPPTDDRDTMRRSLEAIDGLVLTGGADINPLFLGEEPVRALSDINPQRDRFELLLTRLAADRQIPLLGICRGIQVMNAAFGGTLYQDIYSEANPPEGADTATAAPLIKHSQQLSRGIASHSVRLAKDSLLSRIFSTDRLAVNSFHHQAVKEAAPGFRVTARSADGIVEAIESTEFKSMMGVQWHPECFTLEGDESMRPLFEWFIGEALSFRRAKRIHREVLTFDSHCDTPMFFDKGVNIARRDPQLCVDLHKMTEGRLDATLMVAYLKQEERTPEALAAANRKAHAILDEIERRVGALQEYIEIARTPDDLYRLKAAGKKAVMMGVENGYAIGLDLTQVEAFRRRGVVYMTLCHNGNNDICGSARYNDEQLGVSPFGAQVIEEMNRVGMMVDLSHAGERSFYDALEMSRTPIVCSHSSARALCDHPRNLTDDQMRALARKGGVAQVTLYSGFLRKEGEASIVDAMAHLRHMVDVMGVDHVGIGTDFDGDGGICGCKDASELIQLTRRMLSEQFTQEDIRLLWGGNFLRVMEGVQLCAGI
jgi:microsomal dipeptidase-like Zn-dependent dipeptidase/gamma-glutamyl-gamma-aminobutyrate hydrolase PuuD